MARFLFKGLFWSRRGLLLFVVVEGSMQALTADAPGNWQFQRNIAVPVCGATDVLIRVAVTDLNPVDLQKLTKQRTDSMQIIIPGYSGSGVIEQMGANVHVLDNDRRGRSSSKNLKVGARVAFLADPSRSGSYAEYIAVDHRAVAVIPGDNNISFQQAAAVPLAGCTAYESLQKLGVIIGKSSSSDDESSAKRTTIESLLIVGAAGGVGSWAIALARTWQPNIRIICTASSKESRAWCEQQGADSCIGHDEIESLGGGIAGSVDAILCLTEPVPALLKSLSEVIRPYGSICLVVAGASINSLDLGFVFFKCANVLMQTVFSSFRTEFAHCLPSAEIAAILQRMETGELRAPVSEIQDWKLAVQPGSSLLAKLATGHTQGKLSLQIASDLKK